VDAVAREERFVIVGAERGDIKAPAILQQDARLLATRRPESNQLHATRTPPSMGYAWPVTNAASSEQRYNASVATSSGVPIRPIGWYSSRVRRISASRPGICARRYPTTNGVCTRAGQMQLHRMPRFT